jgi:hypothetical protein
MPVGCWSDAAAAGGAFDRAHVHGGGLGYCSYHWQCIILARLNRASAYTPLRLEDCVARSMVSFLLQSHYCMHAVLLPFTLLLVVRTCACGLC